eukprot:PLAT7020.25.p1 GENE.PLAT7020.25~~PLAT7020.25.p1  ORF type:complete len:725 (+),score=373.05 PLAT7020.25:22-2175(+)
MAEKEPAGGADRPVSTRSSGSTADRPVSTRSRTSLTVSDARSLRLLAQMVEEEGKADAMPVLQFAVTQKLRGWRKQERIVQLAAVSMRKLMPEEKDGKQRVTRSVPYEDILDLALVSDSCLRILIRKETLNKHEMRKPWSRRRAGSKIRAKFSRSASSPRLPQAGAASTGDAATAARPSRSATSRSLRLPSRAEAPGVATRELRFVTDRARELAEQISLRRELRLKVLRLKLMFDPAHALRLSAAVLSSAALEPSSDDEEESVVIEEDDDASEEDDDSDDEASAGRHAAAHVGAGGEGVRGAGGELQDATEEGKAVGDDMAAVGSAAVAGSVDEEHAGAGEGHAGCDEEEDDIIVDVGVPASAPRRRSQRHSSGGLALLHALDHVMLVPDIEDSAALEEEAEEAAEDVSYGEHALNARVVEERSRLRSVAVEGDSSEEMSPPTRVAFKRYLDGILLDGRTVEGAAQAELLAALPKWCEQPAELTEKLQDHLLRVADRLLSCRAAELADVLRSAGAPDDARVDTQVFARVVRVILPQLAEPVWSALSMQCAAEDGEFALRQAMLLSFGLRELPQFSAGAGLLEHVSVQSAAFILSDLCSSRDPETKLAAVCAVCALLTEEVLPAAPEADVIDGVLSLDVLAPLLGNLLVRSDVDNPFAQLAYIRALSSPLLLRKRCDYYLLALRRGAEWVNEQLLRDEMVRYEEERVRSQLNMTDLPM